MTAAATNSLQATSRLLRGPAQFKATPLPEVIATSSKGRDVQSTPVCFFQSKHAQPRNNRGRYVYRDGPGIPVMLNNAVAMNGAIAPPRWFRASRSAKRRYNARLLE